MQVNTIFNKQTKNKHVVVYEETCRNGTEYRVEVFKRGIRVEEVKFHNPSAARMYAEMMLK